MIAKFVLYTEISNEADFDQALEIIGSSLESTLNGIGYEGKAKFGAEIIGDEWPLERGSN